MFLKIFLSIDRFQDESETPDFRSLGRVIRARIIAIVFLSLKTTL